MMKLNKKTVVIGGVISVVILAVVLGVVSYFSPKKQNVHSHAHAAATYVCPMHPEVKQCHKGKCPKCGMDLVLSSSADTSESGESTTYTCSMHPNVRQDHPGSCPICGMDLIPAAPAKHSGEEKGEVTLSEEAAALANIETEVVRRRRAKKSVRLFGKIEADERRMQIQSSYVSGRVERLYVSATGDKVAEGQAVMDIYSPELYTAQQELIAATSISSSAEKSMLIDAAIEKLRLLNVSDAVISEVMNKKKASAVVTLTANTTGRILELNVRQGDYVNMGQALLRIVDFTEVWGVFKAYEEDLAFLKVGDAVSFEVEAIPGRFFSGRVSFIEPTVDAVTRTTNVRVEVKNRGEELKPEMLIVGNVETNVGLGGGEIVVAKSAVLWTGPRSLVYVKVGGDGGYEMREITLGQAVDDGYVVKEGLMEGEEIVTNGVFAIDASAQLDGKPSMMRH